MAVPQPRAREFTPDDPPESFDVALPLFELLDEMAIETRPQLNGFLDAWSETLCWIDEYSTRVRLQSMRFTDDEAGRARLKHIGADLLPEVTKWNDRLSHKCLGSPCIDELSDGAYAPWLRRIRTEVELFSEENVPFLQRERELANSYHHISATWQADLGGSQHTRGELLGFLDGPDRELRAATWASLGEPVAATSDEMEELFEELFAVRRQIARNAGFDSYRDYAFKQKMRDYTPETCHRFARSVESVVLPLERALADDWCARVGASTYCPWDLRAPEDEIPLRPFEQTDELIEAIGRMLARTDPEIAELFQALRDQNAMDLETRANKAGGSWAWWFPWQRSGFVYANAPPTHKGVIEVLHEAGHVFHFMLAAANGAIPMGNEARPPMEFNELASMTMELLPHGALDELYGPEDCDRAIRQHLRRVVREFTRTIIGDQFQHWLYENPNHSRDERRTKYVELQTRYAPHVDNSSVERQFQEDHYHRVVHFFALPFYYIEYGFAQFGALQIARRAARDPSAAIGAYKDAMRLGARRSAPELYAAAGVEFEPTPKSLGALMDWVGGRLGVARRP